MHVQVGVLSDKGGSEPHDGDTKDPITLVELAAIHEFGAPEAGIPERSFLRSTFIDKRAQLEEFVAKLTQAVYKGRVAPQQALGLLGEWASSQVRATIKSGPHIPPPLKPATVARKGSTRPLVDTSQLANSVTYLVRDGAPEDR